MIELRNGKRARKPDYHIAYWDFHAQNDQHLNLESGETIPLMELIRRAGFSEEELAKL